MLDFFIDLDKSILLLCNGTHTPWLDNFNWMITARSLNIFVALPLLLFAGHIIVEQKKQGVVEALLLIVALAVAVLIADQVASSVFKPLFQRLRPSHDPSLSVVLVNGYHGGMYGFISSHAANTFAAAVFLMRLFRNRYFSVAILFWAVTVSYSRIYMGVHFPGDILCGAAMGALAGYVVYALYEWSRRLSFLKLTPPIYGNPYRRGAYARGYAFSILLLYIIIGVVAFVQM